MSAVHLKGIRRVYKSRDANRYLGSLPSHKRDWLLGVLREITEGVQPIYPSLLEPNLYHIRPVEELIIEISVKGDAMSVLDIRGPRL